MCAEVRDGGAPQRSDRHSPAPRPWCDRAQRCAECSPETVQESAPASIPLANVTLRYRGTYLACTPG